MAKGDPGIATYFIVGLGAFLLLKTKPAGAATITPTQKALSTALPSSPSSGTGSAYNIWIQETLNQIFPSANLKRDGIIGPLTRQYVMKFQEMWGIAVDGVVGPETDYYLRSALGMTGYTDSPYAYTAQNTWY